MTSKKSAMDDQQKLFPQMIYRINKIFPSIIKILDKETGNKNKTDESSSALFFLYDPHTRVFNSLYINQWEMSEEVVKNFISFLNNIDHKKEWANFKNKFNNNNKIPLITIKKSIEFIEKNLLEWEENGEIPPVIISQTYSHIVNLFEHYPREKNRNIDGTFYRIFEKFKNENTWKINYAKVKLLFTDNYLASFSKYPPIEIEFYSNRLLNAKYLMFAFQENENQYDDKGLFHIEIENQKEIEKQKKEQNIEDDPNFYDNYFFPYLLNWMDGENFYLLNNWFSKESLSFEDLKYNLIIPFYDAYIDGRQCGNLRSNLTVTLAQQNFNDDETTKNIAEKIKRKYRSVIIQEITAARIFEILQQDITGDTIKCFIRHITLLQDWERIVLWNIKKKESIFFYGRSQTGHWESQDDPGISIPDQLENKKIYHEYFKDVESNKKTWIKTNHLFNKETIGDHDVDQGPEFQNCFLMFEYPLNTVFPCCEDDEETEMIPALWNFYANQMIEVMRQMRLKRKVIIDTAIHGAKSASAGIMTRNLSHNIGSHILAYWAGTDLSEAIKGIEKEKTKPGSSDLDAVSEVLNESKKLFQYLQQRMDFLAEITTSFPSSQMSMDFKIDVLEPLIHTGNNIDNKKARGVFPLTKYICYSDSVGSLAFPHNTNINTCKFIKYEEEKDCNGNKLRVSIPNGVVGAQAVYVIIENFFRNCSKHYRGKKTEIGQTIFEIQLKEPKNNQWAEKYVEVRLRDLRKNSCNHKDFEKILSFIDYKNKSYKDNGSFITDNGTLIYKGWGLKEMLIAANFLRVQNIENVFTLKETPENVPPLISLICGEKQYPPSDDQLKCIQGKCTTDNNICISFFLLKPKDLLVEGVADTNTSVFKAEKVISTTKDKEYPHAVFLAQENNSLKIDNPKHPCRKLSLTDYQKEPIDDKRYLSIYLDFINKMLNPLETQFTIHFMGVPTNSYEGLRIKTILKNPIVSFEKISDFNDKDNNNPANSAIFLRHIRNSDPSVLEELMINSSYFQPLSAQFSINHKLSQFSNDKAESNDLVMVKNHFLLELLESIKTKIFIIDERISKTVESEWLATADESISLSDLYTMMGIHIIDITKDKIHWQEGDGLTTWDDLKNRLSAVPVGPPTYLLTGERPTINLMSSDPEQVNNTFLVIHQGIGDKLGPKYRDQIKNINCRWKVVTSGRGIPQDPSTDMRFTELSGIIAMLNNYDKLGLVQLLHAARHPDSKTV